MAVAMSACLIYLACVGFFQASPKRTQLAAVRGSVAAQRAVQWASWGLAVAPLAVLGSAQGLERAIPVWLVLLSLAGILSLLVSAIAPARHLLTGAMSSAVAVVLLTWSGLRAAGLIS